jgi:hypothetical protein
MARRRPTALLILFVLVCAGLVFLLRIKDEMVDFEVNYQAGQRLRLGETLYRVQDGHYQFKYLPFSAFLYLPLTVFPLPLAKAVWYAVVVLCSIWVFVLSSQIIDNKENKCLWPVFLSALILARFFLREIQLGQINALITVLLLVMIRRLAQPDTTARQLGAGASAGLATALKPYALIFFPYFAIRKKWPTLTAGLIVLGLALFAPSLFYGLKGNIVVLGEWRSSLAASTPSLFSSQDNISLIGLLMKWTGNQGLSLAFYTVILVLLGIFVLVLLRRGSRISQPAILDGCLLLALTPLISPLGWDYTLLSSAPAVMLILSRFDKYPAFWKGLLVLDLLLIAFSLYDIMGRELYAAFMSLSVITVSFLVLVGYLAYLRIKGYA